MEMDVLFRALADRTRRRLLDELAERDGQTLFELHVRLLNWEGISISRQALSKHLGLLEQAGVIRTNREWRSKRHYLEREPLQRLWRLWLGPLSGSVKEQPHGEDHCNERVGG
jgi:DNA-binding transcriptional ArsR family regulator